MASTRSLANPVGIGVQAGYAAGNLGKSVVWTTFETFLLFYLISQAGLSPVFAGGLLMAVMLWDAVADLLIGYAADRYGRRPAAAGITFAAAALCGFSFWMIFANLGDPEWRTAQVIAACVLCRIFYTVCDVTHNMLIVRVSPGPRDAALVSGLRLICSAAGAALVGAASTHILAIADAPLRQAAFSSHAAVGGSLYAILLIAAFAATLHLPPPIAATRDWRVADAARMLWRDRGYRRLLAIIAVQAGLGPLFVKTLPFFAQAVRGDAAWAGPALATVAIAQAAALPLWIALARRMPAHRVLRLSHIGMIAALALIGLDASAVGLPLMGVAQAGMGLAVWALLATTIGTGCARSMGLEALPVGLFLAVLKIAAGAGTVMLAGALEIARGGQSAGVAGYDPGPIMAVAVCAPMIGSAICLCLFGRPKGRAVGG